MKRPWAVALAASALAASLLGGAGPAGADEPRGQWTSPGPNAGPAVGQPELAGSVTHDDPVRPVAEVTFVATPLTQRPEGCPAPPALPARRAEGPTVSWRFLPGPVPQQPDPAVTYYAGFACNGTYQLSATPRLANEINHRPPGPIKATLLVAIPPPAPSESAVVLERQDGARVATVTWSEPESLPPDAVGYVVERSIGSGAWQQVAAVPQGGSTWTDADPETRSGEFHYRISTVRLGASGNADDLVASAPSEEQTLDVPPTPKTKRAPDADGPAPTGAPAGPRQLATSGKVANELERQAAVVGGPPTTVDNGFNQTLDYGRRRVGKATGGGGGTILDVLGETPEERQEVLTPVAGGLVLLMWFALLRYLLRQAAKPGGHLPQSSTA